MKIAIVKLSALGDIVHSMIVLQFIKKQYPKSEVDWFVEKRFKGILENNPHINQIQQINLKSAKESKSFFLFWKELRKIRKLGKYDLVIDMQGLIKSADELMAEQEAEAQAQQQQQMADMAKEAVPAVADNLTKPPQQQ